MMAATISDIQGWTWGILFVAGLEELSMLSRRLSRARKPLFGACAIICAMLLAGCDEYVHITRDRDVQIARHATWAWRPAQEESRRGSRPVVSRDVFTRNETVHREDNAGNEAFRGTVKIAIARNVTEKGLKEASDPATAH